MTDILDTISNQKVFDAFGNAASSAWEIAEALKNAKTSDVPALQSDCFTAYMFRYVTRINGVTKEASDTPETLYRKTLAEARRILRLKNWTKLNAATAGDDTRTEKQQNVFVAAKMKWSDASLKAGLREKAPSRAPHSNAKATEAKAADANPLPIEQLQFFKVECAEDATGLMILLSDKFVALQKAHPKAFTVDIWPVFRTFIEGTKALTGGEAKAKKDKTPPKVTEREKAGFLPKAA